MTHRQILLDELAVHGRTTYHDLMQKYGQQGYTIDSFRAAVHWARQNGLVAPVAPGRDIVRVDVCPCCGRKFQQGRV